MDVADLAYYAEAWWMGAGGSRSRSLPHAIEALLMGDLERRRLSEIISIDVLAARNRPVRQNVMPPLGAAEGSGGDVR
jgi:hypothetical protein